MVFVIVHVDVDGVAVHIVLCVVGIAVDHVVGIVVTLVVTLVIVHVLLLLCE